MSDDLYPEPSADEMDELNRLLGNTAVWAEPSPGVEDRIVDAIAAQAGSGTTPAARPAFNTETDPLTDSDPHIDPAPNADPAPNTPGSTTDTDPGSTTGNDGVVDLGERRARRGGQRRLWPLAAAAALLVAFAAGLLFDLDRFQSSDVTTVALAPTELAPGASAIVKVDEQPNGAQLLFNIDGLEPAPPGFFYEVWLVREEPRTVISAGTFHMRGSETGEIEFWAGVSSTIYSTITVTLETEADPDAPGELILIGKIPETP